MQLRQLREAAWPLFMEPEAKWYRLSPSEQAGVRQFLVQDPDGYLGNGVLPLQAVVALDVLRTGA